MDCLKMLFLDVFKYLFRLLDFLVSGEKNYILNVKFSLKYFIFF